MAEAVFKKIVKDRMLEDKFFVDSAGTSRYHIGQDPDPRTISCATSNTTPIYHKARQVTSHDYHEFDFVLVMDKNNYRDTVEIFGKQHPNFYLMRDFDDEADVADVPDPYFGGMDGFQEVHDILVRSCNKLLDHIIETKSL